MNLGLLDILVEAFTRGMVPFYHDTHAPLTLSMHQIRHAHLTLNPRNHVLLFPYHIILFYFRVLYPLKLHPNQADFHLDPQKLYH